MKRLPRRATRRGRTGKLGRKAKGRETSKGTEARPADKVSLDFLSPRHRQASLDAGRRPRGGSAGAKRSANGAPNEGGSSRSVL